MNRKSFLEILDKAVSSTGVASVKVNPEDWQKYLLVPNNSYFIMNTNAQKSRSGLSGYYVGPTSYIGKRAPKPIYICRNVKEGSIILNREA